MATFDEFYSSLDSDPGIRGKQFEKFVKWFLKNDPVWASQVKDIWLWNEHPKRSEWGPDCGIDLVFEDFQNKTWAVQAKCFAAQSNIKKEDMDSFISESSDSRFQGRLLVASTDRIGNNADRLLNRHEVVRYLLNDFHNAQLDFPESPKDLSKGKRKDLRKPRPHQLDAINAVEEGLKTNDRGQVLMACGTGKTLTSLWIKERLEAKEVLVLLPSLSLLSQTLKEWNATASKPFKWICVCSDKSVAKIDKTEDEWITNTSEIGVPVTSEIKEINKFLNEKGSKVIFSTYQSSSLVSQAQKENEEHNFDVAFADEAHRCAGKVSDAFGGILDEKKIRAVKRLFFTATPKILSNHIKGKAKTNDIEIASMDEISIFGKILYQLNFSEAIKKNLLSDYRVAVIGIDNEMIFEMISNRDLITTDGEQIFEAENLSSKIALIKALKDYELKRVISFHGRIKNAEKFANNLKQVLSLIDKSELPSGEMATEYISGEMSTAVRNEKIQRLKNTKQDERRILTNARCLSEGVDVPTLDGIAFIDPKSSQVDIIQAVGRAIRKSEDKSYGTILIPVYLGKLENTSETIAKSRFNDVWRIILALKSQDDQLMESIDQLRINLGRKKPEINSFKGIEKIHFDLPKRVSASFASSIKTILVQETSQNWYEQYGELLDYVAENKTVSVPRDHKLVRWVSQQMTDYKRGLLPQEKINLLEKIEYWVWDRRDLSWLSNFEKLQKFTINNGHSSPSRGQDCFGWVSNQRTNYRKKELSEERIKKLENLKGWSWEVRKSLNHELWDKKYKEFLEYIKVKGNCEIRAIDGDLGAWVHSQRSRYRAKEMHQYQIDAFNQITDWKWEINSQYWNEMYTQLKLFIKNNGHIRPEKNSPEWRWIQTMRTQFKRKNLSKEKIVKLEHLNGWSWNPLDDKWNKSFNELKKFINQNKRLPKSTESNFLAKSRQQYKKGTLSKERIKLLESIKGWKWSER